MSCCCLKILLICGTSICDRVLIIPQVAEAVESGLGSSDNIYSLISEFLGSSLRIEQNQVEGENIQFDVSSLNESFEFTARIFDPMGQQVNILSGDEIYDCIKFKLSL